MLFSRTAARYLMAITVFSFSSIANAQTASTSVNPSDFQATVAQVKAGNTSGLRIVMDSSNRISQIYVGQSVVTYTYAPTTGTNPVHGRPAAMTVNGVSMPVPAAKKYSHGQVNLLLKKVGLSKGILTNAGSSLILKMNGIKPADCPPVDEEGITVGGTKKPAADDCGGGSGGGDPGSGGGDPGSGGGDPGSGGGGTGDPGGSGSTSSTDGYDNGTGTFSGALGVDLDDNDFSDLESFDFWSQFLDDSFDATAPAPLPPDQCALKQAVCIAQCNNDVGFANLACVAAGGAAGVKNPVGGFLIAVACLYIVHEYGSSCNSQCAPEILCQ